MSIRSLGFLALATISASVIIALAAVFMSDPVVMTHSEFMRVW